LNISHWTLRKKQFLNNKIPSHVINNTGFSISVQNSVPLLGFEPHVNDLSPEYIYCDYI